MEAICSSETSVDFQRTTQRYIPEDITLHNHRCENLKYTYDDDDDDNNSINNDNNVFESRSSQNGTPIAMIPTCFILGLQIANTVYAYYTLLKNVADS
jgi:hypothetical protein